MPLMIDFKRHTIKNKKKSGVEKLLAWPGVLTHDLKS